MIHKLQPTYKSDEQNTRAATSPPVELPVREVYKTSRGIMYHGNAETALSSPLLAKYEGKVQLIFTSPPFPLIYACCFT